MSQLDDLKKQFGERVREIDDYLKVLRRIEEPDVILLKQATGRKVRVFGDDSFKVMKATVFLLLYNLVESTIRTGFEAIYDVVGTEQLKYEDVCDGLKSIWLNQKFRSLDSVSATQRTYRDLSETIATEIMNGKVLEMNARKLPISGSLDANKIRTLCRAHGISQVVHHHARGGSELETVKTHRNHLGHGNTTFTDCGKDFTVNDLLRIKSETVVFLRSVLRNFTKYVDSALYQN